MQHDSYSPSENFVNQYMNSYRKSHLPVYIVDIIVKLMFCDDLPEKSGGGQIPFCLSFSEPLNPSYVTS
jgi:hypothetical protein